MIKGSCHTVEAREKMSQVKQNYIPWNKGVSCSEETRKKISETLSGHIPWNKGILMSEEAKRNMSIAQLGNKNKLGTTCTEEAKKNISEAHKGKTASQETKDKMSKTRKGRQGHNKGKKFPKMSEIRKGHWTGKNNPRWKGGITSLTKTIRHTFEYKEWRLMVFGRDNFTCKKCGKRGSYLHAHHIKTFSSIIQKYEITTLREALNCEALWDINNGITLCKECHKKLRGEENEFNKDPDD